MALLEREAQLEKLEGLLAGAASGRGRVAALTGEAGAGKTSLTEAFISRAADGTRILRSACEDLSIPDPLGPLYDLARAARWALPRADNERPGWRLPLFSDALEIFDADAQPNLLVIEDLHWADDATLDFVRYLGRRIRDTHILLLLTARDDGSAAQARVRRALADIPSDNLARIAVPLLTEAAVLALARAAGQDGDAIYRATVGNAFFVTELLRAGSDQGPPPGVRDAVLRRAERLSRGARSALDAVSVFPRRAELSVLQVLCGADGAGRLAECVANGMLVQVDEDYAFRHEIARRALEAALPAPLRLDLNARALAALRSVGGAATARLLHHAVEARDASSVRELAPPAAREAAHVGAHREAAGYYRAALREAGGVAGVERAALYESYAFECHLIGDLQEAVGAGLAARELHLAAGDRLREGDCVRWLSRFSYLAGERMAADSYAREAVELLLTVPPGPELAMAFSNLSQLAMLAGRDDETRLQGEIALATKLGRPDIVCHALNNVGATECWFDADKGRRQLEQSLQIALEQNLPEHAARAFVNLAYLEIGRRSYAEARSVLDAGISYCLERDLDTWHHYLLGTLAELLLRQGRWDEAADAAQAVVANDAATPLIRFPAVMATARLRLRRGDPAEALFAELGRFLERSAELPRLVLYASLMAERAWLGQGDADEALRLIDRAAAMAQSRAAIAELVVWRRRLAPDDAAGDIADLPGPFRLQLTGDWRAAAACWAEIGAPFERALALLAGDEAAQRAALSTFESLGAKPVAAHVRTLMRQSGIRGIVRGPRPATRANPAGLTTRQMDVLRLIERGFSNKKIAAGLAISPKTVDHHVSAVLEKLEASSRGEALAAARAVGLL